MIMATTFMIPWWMVIAAVTAVLLIVALIIWLIQQFKD